jgi:uncharacterized protein
MIEQAEDALIEMGFTGVRVRHHETLARIEVPLDQLPRIMEPAVRTAVVDRLIAVGFVHVTIDLAGYRMGSVSRPPG